MKKISLLRILSRKLFVISLILSPLSSLAEDKSAEQKIDIQTTESKSKPETSETSSWGKEIENLVNKDSTDSKPSSEAADSKSEIVNEKTEAVDSQSNKGGFFSKLIGGNKGQPVGVASNNETTEVKSDSEVVNSKPESNDSKPSVVDSKSVEVASNNETTEVKSDSEVVSAKTESSDSKPSEVDSKELVEKTVDVVRESGIKSSEDYLESRPKVNETVENKSKEETVKQEQLKKIEEALVSVKIRTSGSNIAEEKMGIRVNNQGIIIFDALEQKSFSVKVNVNPGTENEKTHKARFIHAYSDLGLTLLQFKKEVPGSFIDMASATDINFKGEKTPVNAYFSLETTNSQVSRKNITFHGSEAFEASQGEVLKLHLSTNGRHWLLETSVPYVVRGAASFGLYLTNEGKLLGLYKNERGLKRQTTGAILIDHFEQRLRTGEFNIDKTLMEKKIPPALTLAGEERLRYHNDKGGFELLKEAADLGDVRASAILMDYAYKGVEVEMSFENLKKDVLSKGQVPILLEVGKRFYKSGDITQATEFFTRASKIGQMSPGRPGMQAGMLMGIFHEKGLAGYQMNPQKAAEYYSQVIKGFIQPKLIEEFMRLEGENFKESFLNMYTFAKNSSLYTNQNSKHLLINFLDQIKNMAIEMELFEKQEFSRATINKVHFKQAEKVAKPGVIKRALYKCGQAWK